MKMLVIGLGSMGKRRLRNLKALGVERLSGFDPREDRRREAHERYGIATFDDVEAAFSDSPMAVVISTPPDRHLEHAFRALAAGLPFFTEAGIPDARLPELIQQMRSRGVVGMPSCTMRFFAGPRRIKAILASGEVGSPLAWVYHSGQYLRDWHPWESVEAFYVAKADTGACREIVPFELTWLADVFGPVADVVCQRGKLTDLPIEGADIYQLQLRHKGGIFGQLTVDTIARAAVRHIRVLATDGTIEWDATSRDIRVYRSAGKAWRTENLEGGTVETGYINPEEPYIEEMRQFLRCVTEGTEPPYTFDDDLAILNVLLQAERSEAAPAFA